MPVRDDRREGGEQADAALEVLLLAAARYPARTRRLSCRTHRSMLTAVRTSIHRVRIERDQVDRRFDVVGEGTVGRVR